MAHRVDLITVIADGESGRFCGALAENLCSSIFVFLTVSPSGRAAVCRALVRLHACGIIHRDLKSRNVLVTSSKLQSSGKRGDSVRSVLIDFGGSVSLLCVVLLRSMVTALADDRSCGVVSVSSACARPQALHAM
eukprot:SAG22_NODE_475_length_10003_cov_3.943356_6_plen_135_part_00